MVLSDCFRYPFSLINSAKHEKNCTIENSGSISEEINKEIGRSVLKIKGAVSANNYVDFKSLALEGSYIYLQLALLKAKIATFHIEILTENNIDLRITVSTLYDKPRFLGASLRLPLPVQDNWITVIIDINRILAKFCTSNSSKNPFVLKSIKRVQLCSNMMIREFVTSDVAIDYQDTKNLPKDLSLKPNSTLNMTWINLFDECMQSCPSGMITSPVDSFTFSPMTALSPQHLTEKYQNLSSNYEKRFLQPSADSTITNKPTLHISSSEFNTSPKPFTTAISNEPTTSSSGNMTVKTDKFKSMFDYDLTTTTVERNNTTSVANNDNIYTESNIIDDIETEWQTEIEATTSHATDTFTSNILPSKKLDHNYVSHDYNQSQTDEEDPEEILSKMLAILKSDKKPSVNIPKKIKEKNSPSQFFNSGSPQTANRQKLSTSSPSPSSKLAVNKKEYKSSGSIRGRPSSASSVSTRDRSNSNSNSTNSKSNIRSSSTSRRRDSNTSSGGYPSSSSKNRTPSTDTGGARVMNIERVMKYAGGTAALLYNGSLLVVASGPLLILVDIDGQADERCHDERPGLWRAFSPLPASALSATAVPTSLHHHSCTTGAEGLPLRSAEAGDSQTRNKLPSMLTGEPHTSDGLRQACIRGHSANIGILRVSPDNHWLLSCETEAGGGGAATGTPSPPLLILWDLDVGRRATSLLPHGESVQCAEFNGDVSLLVTVGTDICMGSSRTTQTSLFVWDFQTLLLGGAPAPKPIARQISDFNTLAIAFLNCFDKSKQVSLVSCGRENIRFWRVRKGHLPGRPVLLTEFCRGFEFNALGVVYESARSKIDPSAKITFIFAASTKGQLLKVDYAREQVVSAYRLHDCAIRSLAVYPGVVVTGGSDCLLRVWPPDFSDYLLEARHESPVTFLSMSENGMKVTVGTASGTLGVLDLTVHNYRTLLRSHVGAITCVAARPPVYEEFASMGTDGTIRVWDVVSGQQKFEFESSKDVPTTGSYHPLLHVLTCGFHSGAVRVFNVDSTLTLYQLNHRSVPVVAVLYSPVADKLLVSAVDGHICVYNTLSSYQLLKTISGSPVAGECIYMAISANGSLLATSGTSMSSLTVYSLLDLKPVLRVNNGDSPSAAGAGATPILSLTTAADASSSMLLSALQYNASPGSGSQRLGEYTPNQLADSSTYVSPPAKYLGVNTLLSPASLATSNITNNTPHASSPLSLPSSFRDQSIKGLVFCEDDVGFIAILALTEKRIICLSVLVLSIHSNIYSQSGSAVMNEIKEDTLRNNRLEVSWGEVSSRKLDIPNPLSIHRDPETSMIFIPFKEICGSSGRSSSASRKGRSTSIISIDTRKTIAATISTGQRVVSDLDDKHRSSFSPSLAVLIAKLRPTRLLDGTLSRTLVTSSTQAYRELPAVVCGVASSASFGRIVTVDVSGGVSIWTVNPNHIEALSAGTSPHLLQAPDSVKKMLSMMDAKHSSPKKPLHSAKGICDSSEVKRRERERGGAGQSNYQYNNRKSGNDKIIPSTSPRNTGRTTSTSTAANNNKNDSKILVATASSIPSTSGKNTQPQLFQQQQSAVTSGLLRLSRELENTISHLENWDILPSSSSISLDNNNNNNNSNNNNATATATTNLNGAPLASTTKSSSATTTTGRHLPAHQRAVTFEGEAGARSEGVGNLTSSSQVIPDGRGSSTIKPTFTSEESNMNMNVNLNEAKSTGSRFEELLDSVNLGEVEEEEDVGISGDDEMNVYESYDTDSRESASAQRRQSSESRSYQFVGGNTEDGGGEVRRKNARDSYYEIEEYDGNDGENGEQHDVEEEEQQESDKEEDSDNDGSSESSDDDILRTPLMSQQMEEDKKYYELIRPKTAFMAETTDEEEEEQKETLQNNYQHSNILQQQQHQQHLAMSHRMEWTSAADPVATSSSSETPPDCVDHVEFLDSSSAAAAAAAAVFMSQLTQTAFDIESSSDRVVHEPYLSVSGNTATSHLASEPGGGDITVLSQSLTVSPIIGHQSRVLVTTDGHSIFVKDYLTNKTSVLTVNASTKKTENSSMERRIGSLALSNSNLLIAAVIVSKAKGEGEGEQRNSKPVEPESRSNRSPLKYELMIWRRIGDPRDVSLGKLPRQCWEAVRHREGGSGSSLRLGDGTDRLYIDWHRDDSLVVLSPLGATGDSLVSLLPAARLLAGDMPKGADISSVLLEEDVVVVPPGSGGRSSGEVLDMKVLDTKAAGMAAGGEVRVVILRNYSAVIVSVLFGRSTKAMILHKQEVDPSGSFLSLSISSSIWHEGSDSGLWRQRLVLLDSLGKLRFISITSTRIDSLLTKFRKSSATTTPLSVCLSPDSRWLLLNSSGILRVFRVELLENNDRNRNRARDIVYEDEEEEEDESNLESDEYETTSSVWKEGAVAVTLRFQTKILLGFSARYLLFMPTSQSLSQSMDSTPSMTAVTSSVDFLLGDETGIISFVRVNGQVSPKISQGHSSSSSMDGRAAAANDLACPVLIQSGLPPSSDIRYTPLPTHPHGTLPPSHNYAVPSLTLLGNRKVLALLNNKGKILFYHADSGIRLPDLDSTGGASCTCVASAVDTVAIGLSSGNVALYNCHTLALQQLLSFKPPPVATAKEKTGDSSKGKGGVTAIDSMLFLARGEMLLVLHVDGTITLCDLRSTKTSANSLAQSYIISQSKVTTSNTTTATRRNQHVKVPVASHQEIVLVSTENNPNMFGILCSSTAILELYKISFTTTNSFGLPCYSNIKGGHAKIGKIGSICLVNFEKQMLRITNICLISHTNDLRIFATTQNAHSNKKPVDSDNRENAQLIPDGTLNIAIINKKEDLFEGDSNHMETVTVIMRKIMDLGTISTSIFKSNYCLFATSEVVKLVDLNELLAGNAAASSRDEEGEGEGEERKESIVADSNLENGSCIRTLQTFGKSKEVNWENSLSTLCFDDRSSNNAVVYLLRCNSPMLLKIVF